VTVAVLREPTDAEVRLDDRDLEFKTCRGSGAGGQHRNTTDSAVQLTHKPTGIQVRVESERSQHQNKEKAMRHLRAKLMEMEKARQQSETAHARRTQVRSGDRSEKIRTYNFPQNRITDHRIGLTLHNLQSVLNGELDKLIIPLLNSENKAGVPSGAL